MWVLTTVREIRKTKDVFKLPVIRLAQRKVARASAGPPARPASPVGAILILYYTNLPP